VAAWCAPSFRRESTPCRGSSSVGEHGVLQTFALDLDGERIRAIYVTRNPDKLRGVEARLGNLPL
jgi:hypothetical protein